MSLSRKALQRAEKRLKEIWTDQAADWVAINERSWEFSAFQSKVKQFNRFSKFIINHSQKSFLRLLSLDSSHRKYSFCAFDLLFAFGKPSYIAHSLSVYAHICHSVVFIGLRKLTRPLNSQAMTILHSKNPLTNLFL